MSLSVSPTFVRLEEWDGEAWQTRMEGVNLMYPEKYPERLAAHGKVARAVALLTGEVFAADDAPPGPGPSVGPWVESEAPAAEECLLWCGEVHVGANGDGSCLL